MKLSLLNAARMQTTLKRLISEHEENQIAVA